MEQLPEKYQHLLGPGETVIYHEDIGKNSDRALLLEFAVALLLILFFILYNMVEGANTYNIFILIVVGILVFYYFRSSGFYFIATSNGIKVNNNLLHSFFNIPYSKIYRLSIKEGIANNNLILHRVYPIKYYTDDNKENLYSSISGLKNPRHVMNTITQNWFINSPYQEFNKILKSISEKYELNLKAFEAHDRSRAVLTGTINGMDIKASLGSIYDLKDFQIDIKCPNEENNYFLIQDEKMYSGIQKMLGKQDLKIGNISLDNYFIFQSSNRIFFDFIMDSEVQREIPKAWRKLTGTLKMGKPKKIEKSKSNKHTDMDILDSHLLHELEPIIDRQKGLTSTLSYESRNIASFENRFPEMGSEIDIILDTVILIAQRIKAYNKQ